MKYHFTPVRMTIMKKRKSIGKNVEKGESSYTIGRNVQGLSRRYSAM